MAVKTSKLRRKTLFDYVDIIILLILGFITFYPFWNILMISFNDPTDTLLGGITLYVRKFTLDNYQYFFRNDSFINAFWVSVSRTVIGSLTSVIFTAAFAYGK